MESGNPPWNFGAIRKLPKVTGPWKVNVKQAGRYRFTLRQYPAPADKDLIKVIKAKISIAGIEKEIPVEKGAKSAIIELDLPTGPTDLITYLYYSNIDQPSGAYFTDVELLD